MVPPPNQGISVENFTVNLSVLFTKLLLGGHRCVVSVTTKIMKTERMIAIMRTAYPELNSVPDDEVNFRWLMLSRRDNPWFREHTKKSQTPMIVKKWKDSFPAPLAVLLFHECDIIRIEKAYHFDFIVLKVKNGGLPETWIAFVYAYLEVTGQLEGHGVWYGGVKAAARNNMNKFKAIAKKLARFSTEVENGNYTCLGDPTTFDGRYAREVVEETTADLKPFSFGGDFSSFINSNGLLHPI